MRITRNNIETAKGPADWFTGDVYSDVVAAPDGSSTFAAANVHFTPAPAAIAVFDSLQTTEAVTRAGYDCSTHGAATANS